MQSFDAVMDTLGIITIHSQYTCNAVRPSLQIWVWVIGSHSDLYLVLFTFDLLSCTLIHTSKQFRDSNPIGMLLMGVN